MLSILSACDPMNMIASAQLLTRIFEAIMMTLALAVFAKSGS